MCKRGRVFLVWSGKKMVDVDSCIAPIVKSLNDGGIKTVASCCGHGIKPGNIALKDGRELIISPDYETTRMVEKYFKFVEGK